MVMEMRQEHKLRHNEPKFPILVTIRETKGEKRNSRVKRTLNGQLEEN